MTNLIKSIIRYTLQLIAYEVNIPVGKEIVFK